jgi:hypothetical protein
MTGMSRQQGAGRMHTVLLGFVIPTLAALAAAVLVTVANAGQWFEPPGPRAAHGVIE